MTGDARVEQLARGLRQWIEQQDRSTWPEPFANFPTGSCELSAHLLALWLEENDESGFELCLEGICTDKEHAFLIRDGLVADITGDQFGWPPVIVTRSSEWHRDFVVVDLIEDLKPACRQILDRSRPAIRWPRV